MTIDISPEAVAEFIRRHRQLVLSSNESAQALDMLAALSAEVKRLQETCGGCEQFETLHKERDALKADIVRKDKALKALDDSWTESFPDGPDTELKFGHIADEHKEIWRKIRAALQPAKEPSL